MPLVPKIDPNKIFASNAPSQDKPAAFDNYEKGLDETRKNLGRPTIKQLNYLHQTADQKILWIHQNGGGLPYDPLIEYAENAVTLKDGELQKKQGVGWVIPYLGKSNNLDDVPDKATARNNLEVMSATEVNTAISNAIPPTTTDATETVAGKVKINNTLNSTATDAALTAAQGKVLNDQAFGVGQSWVDVRSTRLVNTLYTNATNKPISVSIANPTVYWNEFSIVVGGVVIQSSVNNYQLPISIIFNVPVGATYRVNSGTFGITGGVTAVWAELR